MNDARLGPQTLAFGGYLLLMTVGLAAAAAADAFGSAETLALLALYATLLTILGRLVVRRIRSLSIASVRHECLFFAVSMNVTFQAMGGAIPAIRATRYDEVLSRMDAWFFGISPNVWMERFVSPLLTEVLSACYLFFMPLLFAHLARYFFWRKELLGIFYRGLFTLYGLGFLGYLLVPAAGPYVAFPDLFSVPLGGGPIARITEQMVVAGSNRVDVFPSLHCAISAYILGFAWWYHRREFRWLAVPVAGLWVSTIYLRYHYMVDVVCGFALAGYCLTLVRPCSSPPIDRRPS
jgi:membrane-associated phospholipid phosphatase